MKILNSPFNHKEVCKCGCVLKYKDTDVISRDGGSYNTKIINLSDYPEIFENIKKELSFYGNVNSLLTYPDTTLKISYKSVYFKIICPFCGNEIDIFTYDTNKHEIFQEAFLGDYVLSSKTARKKEEVYKWLNIRMQLLIEKKLCPADIYENLII